MTWNVHDPNPLPFEKYVSTLAVKELGPARCEVQWSAEFESQGMAAEEVVKMIEGLYAMGIDGLRTLAAKATPA